MKNLIATIVILLILGLAIGYIVNQKKKGVKCIGCPSGGNCPSKNSGCCSCSEENK